MAELSCSKSEIDYFSPTPVQVALVEGRWQKFQPQNSVTNANVIEFNITGTENEVIVMNNTSLYIRGKIKKTNGTADLTTADDAKLFPANNMLHSLFKHVDVMVNGQLTTRAGKDYPYKAILTRLTQEDMPMVGLVPTHLWLEGWMTDEADDHSDSTKNESGYKRYKIIEKSRTFELTGTPAIDLFQSDKALPAKCDLTLRFYLNEPEFYLIDEDTEAKQAGGLKLIIEEAYMKVRKATVIASFCKSIQEQRHQQDMTLNFTRREIAVVNIPQGMRSANRENLFRGTLGVRYFFAMVKGSAYTGSLAECPFDFNHFNLSEFSLTEDGVNMGYGPLKVDIAKETAVIEGYRMLLEIIGAVGERPLSTPITLDHYMKGCFVLAFTRSPDLCHGEHQLPTQTGNLAVNLTFSAATPEAISLICMAEYDSRIIIDNSNNIITNYVI